MQAGQDLPAISQQELAALAKSFWKRVEACQTVAIPITYGHFYSKLDKIDKDFFIYFFFTRFTRFVSPCWSNKRMQVSGTLHWRWPHFLEPEIRRSLHMVNDRNTFIVYLPVSHELAQKKNALFSNTENYTMFKYKIQVQAQNLLCIPLGFVCTKLFLHNIHSPAALSAAHC